MATTLNVHKPEALRGTQSVVESNTMILSSPSLPAFLPLCFLYSLSFRTNVPFSFIYSLTFKIQLLSGIVPQIPKLKYYLLPLNF